MLRIAALRSPSRMVARCKGNHLGSAGDEIPTTELKYHGNKTARTPNPKFRCVFFLEREFVFGSEWGS